MSVILGIRKEREARVRDEELIDLARATRPWAPDGEKVFAKGSIGMALQPYHTHDRSHLGPCPIQDDHGNVLVLDGRLDNHAELRDALAIDDPDSSDARITLAAFVRWGVGCFERFVGDWAIAIWSETQQTLALARDHAGTRSLYFEDRGTELRWSTYLETFVATRDAARLREEYLETYLSGAPLDDDTPYAGIEPVPAGTVVLFRTNHRESFPHWRCYPNGTLRYRTDDDYEEHFLALLKQSVLRRTAPGAPILAQLSGGMDSSTIVCISDLLKQQAGATADDFVDTVSFFDDSEPSWNERRYFTAIEAHRGKVGEHVDVSEVRPSFQRLDSTRISLLPGLDVATRWHTEQFERRIGSRGYRVVLSGIGGDELLGGVPTPLPELSDYLVRGQFRTLWHQAMAWSLEPRKPIVHQLWETVRFAARAYHPLPQITPQPPWVMRRSELRQHHRASPRNAPRDLYTRWRTPSEITTAQTWDILLATRPNLQLTLGERREYRFPYLDRDLVDFLLRVPNEQLVRPGRRRSLMRRALKGIVPEAVLERRRKGYLIRSPMHTIAVSAARIRELMATSQLVGRGLIDLGRFEKALQEAECGVETQWAFALIRTCLLELWLHE